MILYCIHYICMLLGDLRGTQNFAFILFDMYFHKQKDLEHRCTCLNFCNWTIIDHVGTKKEAQGGDQERAFS